MPLLCLGSDDIGPDEARERANSVLEAIAAKLPSKQDVQLASYRLSTLGQASLGGSTPEIRKSAEETLIQLTQCVKPLLPHPPTTPLQTLEGGLTSLVYAPALGNVLRILEGLIMVSAAPWSDAVKKSSALEYLEMW